MTSHDNTGSEPELGALNLRPQAQAKNALLANIVACSDVGIVSKTLDGVITSWNPAAERLLGYSAAEAVGQHISMLIPPEKRGGEDAISKLLSRGETIDHFETTRVGKNGRNVEVSLTISPLRDADGRVIGASKIIRDVAVRRDSQAQNELLARIVACSDDAIISKTLDGVITSWNAGAERLFGYTASEAIGRHSSIIIPPERMADDEAIVERVHKGEAVKDFETTRLGKDGQVIQVSLSVSPLRDIRGRVTGGSTILRDITERKRMQAQFNEQLIRQSTHADEANRTKSEFLSTISHEIRTPMNSILGMADLLWESELDGTQRKYVEVFRRAGANLLTLVNDLLDMSKIESGHFELEQVDFDLAELVERTVEMMAPKAQAKRLALKFHVGTDTPDILTGDPTRLQQILMNLLGNAVKFTASGEVSLSVASDASDPNRLHFQVTDTGLGIPADKLGTIFEDFTQAESSTTRRFGGTGLGLGICRRLVTKMGGELKVRSELEKGSTFYFDAVFSGARDNRRASVRNAADLVGRRVLVIDANSTNRLIFSSMCSSWGMLTSDCATANAGIAVLRIAIRDGKPFDVVIVDPMIPDMDGLELVSKIRQSSSKVRILVAMSNDAPGDQTSIQHLGITGYAIKPVRRAELLRLVCKSLSTSSEQQQKKAVVVDRRANRLEPAGKGRILVAEDSEDNRFLLQVYLKNTPYEVTFVENGKLAVDLARTQSFGLILMDIQMPVMDGLTATKAIREMERDRGQDPTPILALTANAGKHDRQASQEAGCTAHVSKPISKATLFTSIDGHMRRSAVSAIAESKPGPAPSPAPAPALVEIPEGLEEIAAVYFKKRKDEVPHLVGLLEASEFDQLRILAHNMKGTGTSYGFAEMTRLGALIESSAKQKNTAALSDQLHALSQYIQGAESAVCLPGVPAGLPSK